MKLDREKLFRWGRIVATVCRYAGVIVLTFTLTSVMAIQDEFQKQVALPLQSVAGPNWTDDMRVVAEGTKSAMHHMNGEEIASALNEEREEDRELRIWRDELRIANAYAIELEESVIRGSAIKPMSVKTEHSYSPFDSFYGSGMSYPKSETAITVNGKSREDLNNVALRAWNAAMKERNYAVLAISSGAALYPYGGIVSAFLWSGAGFIAAGLSPFLLSTVIGRRKDVPLG